MFPRGPRFPAAKIPEVPGPNAYNPQEPDYDTYKRGAFIEKTNRFSKDKPSEIPGPGAYNLDAPIVNAKAATGPNKVLSADRYAVLQRKLEDLEHIHAEGKKSHQAELERLKLELNRAQRASTEHSERADKVRKQNDALEARLQDLKKNSATEQSELRELRTKLKAAEHERTQLAAKQSEAGEAKKALLAMEAKRKDDLRVRDRCLAELEKALGGERKKRELAEGRLAETKSKVDGEVDDARAALAHLETQLEDAKSEVKDVKAELDDVKARAADREEELLEMLDQHRIMLSRVAVEYGQLVSRSIAYPVHARVRHEADALKIRVFRLERKLANAEGQVIELANLIRQTKDENVLLKARLRETEEERVRHASLLRDAAQDRWHDDPIDPKLESDVETLGAQLIEDGHVTQNLLRTDLHAWVDLHRLRAESLLSNSSLVLQALDESESTLTRRTSELSTLRAAHSELQNTINILRTQHVDVQEELARAGAACEAAKASEAALKKQVNDAKAASADELTRVQQALQREQDAARRAAATARQHRHAEESLRAELDQVDAELVDAERYRAAYGQLLDEVGALVARNALAEEETKSLSKFNAEIVGHQNPAQRIMYLDRIRRELHETKQELLMLTRDRDATLAQNEDLQHELELYRSVAVPPELKPRTMVTRIERLQVPAQGESLGRSFGGNSRSPSSSHSSRELEPEVEYNMQGEMIVNEIM